MAIVLNGNTGIQNVLGSASAPAESNTTSSNTGLYFPSSTTLGLSTNGTAALAIDASQNVGIGTTSPGQKLQVNISSATAYSSGVSGNGLLVYNTSATNGQYVGITFQGEPTTGNAGQATILGTTTSGGNMDLTFSTRGSSTLAERMRIDSSGNVGIGTSSPGYKLQVYATSNSLQIESVVRNDQSGTGVAAIGFNVSSSAAAETSSTKAGIGLVRTNPYGVGALTFYNNNTGSAGDFTTADERMRIDSSGNVGIGTTGPSQKLALGSGSSNVALQMAFNTATGAAIVGLQSDNSFIINQQIGQPLIFNTSNSERMRIDSSGKVAIGTSTPNTNANLTVKASAANDYQIQLEQSNATDGYALRCSAANGDLTFSRYASSAYTERMRLDISGNLLLNTTASYGPAMLSIRSTSSGTGCLGLLNTAGAGGNFVQFVNAANSAIIGTITNNGNTNTAYNTSSDYRLKNSVAPLSNGLATVAALKPVTYKWNENDSHGEGFIAHELQAIIPLAVTGEKDAVDADGKIIPQGVDYSKIVVHLVAAIQELSAKVDAQAAEIAALKGTK